MSNSTKKDDAYIEKIQGEMIPIKKPSKSKKAKLETPSDPIVKNIRIIDPSPFAGYVKMNHPFINDTVVYADPMLFNSYIFITSKLLGYKSHPFDNDVKKTINDLILIINRIDKDNGIIHDYTVKLNNGVVCIL